jgi:hypothetical protein
MARPLWLGMPEDRLSMRFPACPLAKACHAAGGFGRPDWSPDAPAVTQVLPALCVGQRDVDRFNAHVRSEKNVARLRHDSPSVCDGDAPYRSGGSARAARAIHVPAAAGWLALNRFVEAVSTFKPL